MTVTPTAETTDLSGARWALDADPDALQAASAEVWNDMVDEGKAAALESGAAEEEFWRRVRDRVAPDGG